MGGERPRLVPFDPAIHGRASRAARGNAQTNGHSNGHGENGRGRGHRGRRRSAGIPSIAFGALVGGLFAANLIGRLHWLNLHAPQTGWWGRIAIAAAAAGAMTGVLRRDRPRVAAVAGAIAALVALWGVYGMVRLAVPVIWTGRSPARVVTADLLRLVVLGGPAAAAAAGLASSTRGRLERRRSRSARPERDVHSAG